MSSMSSSSSPPPPSKGKRRPGCSIRGPRPQPLIVSPPAEASRPSKKPRVSGGGGAGGDTGPVIVYELTPRVVHARPEEFRTIVQKLTGKPSAAAATTPADSTVTLPADQVAGGRDGTDTAAATAADPLVLALGQQRQPSPPAIDDHPAPPPSPPADAFLLSPSSLFFSPSTMHALQELAAAFF